MDFSVISDNCFGVGVYRYLKSAYTSLFCHTIIPGPDYIRLLKDFDRYINIELDLVSFSESAYKDTHPKTSIIGILGDVEIHFHHIGESGCKDFYYHGYEDIKEKYNRRLDRFGRVARKNVLFKFGGVDNLEETIAYDNFDLLLRDFHSLELSNKVSFTVVKYPYKGNYLIKKKHLLNCFSMGCEVSEYFDIRRSLEL